jgi:hypothetical protein
MCAKHASRTKRHGDPHTVIPVTERDLACGPRSARWLSDDVLDYRTVHMRLRRYFGSASKRLCVDCGKTAAHWAYDHADPDERIQSGGVPYSIDPIHYSPRCASCHKRLDNTYIAHSAAEHAVRELLAVAEDSGNTVAAAFIQAQLPLLAQGGMDAAFATCDGRWIAELPAGPTGRAA